MAFNMFDEVAKLTKAYIDSGMSEVYALSNDSVSKLARERSKLPEPLPFPECLPKGEKLAEGVHRRGMWIILGDDE